MTDDKYRLEEKLMNFMNINEGSGPPRFIADTIPREQWIADTVDAAAVEVGPPVQQMGQIVLPEDRSGFQGLTRVALGFGMVAGLAAIMATVFWPSQSPKNEGALIGPGSTAEVILKEKTPENDKVEPPSEPSKENLDLTVIVSDQGFHFEANPNIRTPWTDHGPTPTIPEYTVPHIPKKDNDWDFAELNRRLSILKDLHNQETTIILELEDNIPYEILLEVMDSSRDTSGEPLFPEVALKGVFGLDMAITIALVVVQFPKYGQEPDESSAEDLNLVVAVTDQGFHFKINPNFRMPWMSMATETGSVGPDIPKKDNDWDYAELKRRLGELKENHSQETSIILGAENHIPYKVFFRAVVNSRGTYEDPLFPDVTLTRLVE